MLKWNWLGNRAVSYDLFPLNFSSLVRVRCVCVFFRCCFFSFVFFFLIRCSQCGAMCTSFYDLRFASIREKTNARASVRTHASVIPLHGTHTIPTHAHDSEIRKYLRHDVRCTMVTFDVFSPQHFLYSFVWMSVCTLYGILSSLYMWPTPKTQRTANECNDGSQKTMTMMPLSSNVHHVV